MKTKKRGLLSWVLEFAGRKRGYFGGSVVLAIFGVAASFIPYLIIARIVEQLLSGNREWRFYLTQVLLMALFWLLRMTLHSFSTSLSHAATFTVLGGIRRQLCEKLSKIPLGSVLDDNSGSYKNIIVERVDSMETTLAHIVPEFTANLLLPVVMFIYIMTIDWRLGLANLVGAGIGLVFMVIMFIKSRGGYELSVEKTKKLNDTAVEYINGIEVIKAFGKTGSSYQKFVTAAREGTDVFIDWMRRCIWPQSGMMAFLPATFLGVLPIGLLLVNSGSLSASGFITCIILSAGLITPLVVAFSYTDDLLKMKTIFGEVTEILDVEQMDIDGEEIKPENRDIHLEHVEFAYENRKIINDVTLDIKENTTTAIVGPSGGGKTTLTSLIARFWDVQEGKITLGGRNVKDYSFDSLMENFSFVFQRVYLFEDTIANNIRFGKPDASMEEVIEAAKKASCHDFITALPNGYETVIGEGGATLSGGEKQRIAIARAMMKDAPIIILDEATANVDPENEKELTEAIGNLTKQKTIIMIAHRLKTVRNADQILVVDQGKIVQKGKHEELIRQDGIYRNFITGRKQAVSWKLS